MNNEDSQTEIYGYFTLGKNAALTNKANPEMINLGLDTAYKSFSKDLFKSTEQRKANISAEVEILNKKLNDLNAKIAPLNLNKVQIEEKVEIIEENILVAKTGEVEVNIIPFAIGSLITLLLTLYLFIFYSSVAYSALFGGGQTKITISNALFNTSVFNNAASQSGGTLAMVFLLPAVFLGLGFLIHDALEKKRVGILVGIVLVTLLFDGLMAYKIAQNNYNVLYNQGVYVKEWSIGYAFKDIDFYLILALGFVVYIIWGYLLDFSIKKWQESQPNNAISLKIESLMLRKENLQNELLEVNTLLNQLFADVKTIEDEKNNKEEILIKLKNGAQAIGETELRGMVGEYMNGWVSFITFYFSQDKANAETERANQISKTWTDNVWNSLINK